jgi:hypothetical protein
MDQAGFVSPMVLPGTYTVRLKVGEKEYTQPLTVVHDSTNKDFTLAERIAQYKAAMQALEVHKNITETIEEVSKKQAQLKKWMATSKNEESKRMMQLYNDSLENYRSTLLATKQKSIFADEEQLRERVTELYTTIATLEEQPSNLQMQRITVLDKQVSTAKQKREELKKQFDPKVDKIVKEEQLETGKVF